MRTRRNRPDTAPGQLWLFPGLHEECAEPSVGHSADPQPSTAACRVVTIPPSEPFLSTLARALLDGTLPAGNVAERSSPLDLSAITLLLPTRRASRALQDAFLAASGSRALLLPTIRPISEGDEDLSLISGLAGAGDSGAGLLDLPPAVLELERQLVLTKLVMQWSEAMRGGRSRDLGTGEPLVAAGANSPAQAANLARELARLIDMVETEAISLDGLANLVREEFSQHWQQTLDFLTIVTNWWPAHLEASGVLSAADRRNRLILAEAARLAASRPEGPVIVAGVTGSIPATVELMRAVAGLPNGALVLPGLDLDLDEPSWWAITGEAAGAKTTSGQATAGQATSGNGGPPHPEHPQFGLKTLLDRLGLDRGGVATLSRTDSRVVPGRGLRAKLVSEAMRPSATTARWQETIATTDRAQAAVAIEAVTLIEAPSPQDEAEAVALILREVAETPGRTAALISPDRLLARRVAIRLEAWGIRVDDSAGRPLRKTPPGSLLDLAIETVARGFAPRPLMALLKHPLVRLGLDPFAIRRAARALELAAFRGPYLGHGIVGIRAALEAAERDCALGPEQRGHRRPRAVTRLFPDDWTGAHDLVSRLEDAFAPLARLYEGETGAMPLAVLAEAHAAVAEALAQDPQPQPEAVAASAGEGALQGGGDQPAAASTLWTGEAGAVARLLFEALTRPGLPAPDLAAADYAEFYRALVSAETVRPRIPVHPRLSIWGPFEARLQQPDVVILGGLNDGTWPESADPGPWLNRPMRAELKLPAPEEKIGYAAHDFCQLMGAPRVYLTRAQKSDGVPTVPSRWLMRLEALLGGLGLTEALRAEQGGATYLAWARQRDKPGRWVPAVRPAPRPPVEMRPRRLSVSAVETWIANPYAIFAGHILRLEALPELGHAPDASVRGGIVHEAMARFARRYPEALPQDIEGELLAQAAVVLHEWTGHPRVAAFWLPRFERFARWFAQTEAARRVGPVLAEVPGLMELGQPGLPFTLSARADRLDIGPDGVVVTDYKTGTPPNTTLVVSGRRPQLPLEAAIAEAKGFAALAQVSASPRVAGLRYIKAAGGDPPGEESAIKTDDLAALIAGTVSGLQRHIARFDLPETPYAATRRAGFNYEFDVFAQLARVAEWSAAGSAGDPGSGGGDEEGGA